MTDALLSPPVGAAFWAISGGTIVYSARKVREEIGEKKIPLMGVLGAFVFAAQMINFTIPGTGSSGHLGGGMILAILLGPHAAFLTLASVLVVQALFFGDGGLLALGSNMFNLGFWPCFIAYPLIYRQMVARDSSPKRMTVAALMAVLVAMQLGALSLVVETLLSGISELPFKYFVLLMQPIHLLIGLVEGAVTAGFIGFVRKARPEILDLSSKSWRLETIPMQRVLIGVVAIALLTAGVFSWFASAYPDGLEWSIQRLYGTSELPEPEEGIIPVLGAIQDRTAILPDYGFRENEPPKRENALAGKGEEEQTSPVIDSGKTTAGIVGAMMTLALSVLLGIVVRRRRRPPG
ncbi:MAG: cobalamin biosynthesis protein CbiM [Proteobacteria bacterium]|nr:cobalamin biosynthesis protein CbiM [Pseudomonadota bacterium]NIS72318.1 cobalamin biosynthesis protein CbiM [Pseudomonadota bacterium]